jgi:hypothetical protein
MMVGTRYRGCWEFGSSGSKHFGRGSCMTVGVFVRMRNGECGCSGYRRPFLERYGSGISTIQMFNNGASPSRVVGDYY